VYLVPAPSLPPAHAVVRPVGTVSVTVPEVATTAGDGLAARLAPGRVRVDLPALLTVPNAERPAWLEVNGTDGPVVTLTSGSPRRLATSFVAHRGTAVTVRLVAGGVVVAVWHHSVSR